MNTRTSFVTNLLILNLQDLKVNRPFRRRHRKWPPLQIWSPSPASASSAPYKQRISSLPILNRTTGHSLIDMAWRGVCTLFVCHAAVRAIYLASGVSAGSTTWRVPPTWYPAFHRESATRKLQILKSQRRRRSRSQRHTGLHPQCKKVTCPSFAVIGGTSSLRNRDSLSLWRREQKDSQTRGWWSFEK